MIKAVAVVAVAPVYSKKFLRLAPLFNYKKHPSFEFKFGNGLGVLAVGNLIPEPLVPLLGPDKTQAEYIGKIFAGLGSQIQSPSKVNNEAKRYLNSILENRDQIAQDRDALRTYLETVEQDRQKLRERLIKTEQKLISVEKDRNDTAKYLAQVEQDRKNIGMYLTTVEQDRKALQTEYEVVTQALTALENSKTVKINKIISSQIAKIRYKINGSRK